MLAPFEIIFEIYNENGWKGLLFLIPTFAFIVVVVLMLYN